MKKILTITLATCCLGLTTLSFAASQSTQSNYAMPKPIPCNKDSKYACVIADDGNKICGCFNKVMTKNFQNAVTQQKSQQMQQRLMREPVGINPAP